MRKLVKFKKSILCFVLSFVIVGTSVVIPYQEAKAEAVVAGAIGVSGGVALLSLAALCGVGMELDNNRRFNDLSDSEKERIQNGLATNFDDVALQRGASLEKIKTWTNDLANGLLDKTSECWGIFKDWVKSINLTDSDFVQPDVGQPINANMLLGVTAPLSNGTTAMITSNMVTEINRLSPTDNGWYMYIVDNTEYSDKLSVFCFDKPFNSDNYTMGNRYNCTNVKIDSLGNVTFSTGDKYLNPTKQYYKLVSSYPCMNGGVNVSGMGWDKVSYFSTNTDYLERLKGEDEDVIDVIDVTDIKNPIIESRPNSLTRIDYNRGGKRPTPDDDDDKVIMGGIVPTNIYYDALDDYNEGLKNEVVIYDNKINENPEDEGKVFVSPAPIVNVNNFFNTLPCVNVPQPNTVVNNNYTYNNYNNNNTTINELPYNSELIPYLPTMLFENKFPFCIPFDIYTLFSVFYVEREAPEFTFDVPFPSENGLEVQKITLGLKDYEYCALVLRVMWYFLFLLGLMLISRKLIKG